MTRTEIDALSATAAISRFCKLPLVGACYTRTDPPGMGEFKELKVATSAHEWETFGEQAKDGLRAHYNV